MANYQILKADIDSKVYENAQQKITGENLNSVLNAMVATLGAEYQFAGVATIDTNPETSDAKVFYIANGKGIYTNFGNIEVTEDDVVILYNDTSWHKVATGIASHEKLTELERELDKESYKVSFALTDINLLLTYADVISQGKGYLDDDGNWIGVDSSASVLYTSDYVELVVGERYVFDFYGIYDDTIMTIPRKMFVYNADKTKSRQITNNFDNIVLSGNEKYIRVNTHVNTCDRCFLYKYGSVTLKDSLPYHRMDEVERKVDTSIKEDDLTLESKGNIINPSWITDGRLLAENGFLYDNTSWSIVTIPVKSGDVISVGGFKLGRYAYYAYYNNDSLVSVVQFLDPDGGKMATLTIPTGVNKLIIDIKTANSPSDAYDKLIANYGADLLPYQPYTEPTITKIKGYPLFSNSGSSISTLIVDLPISDGTDISSGYAYIDSVTNAIKVKS